ncbi:MAG: hypothetical protein FD157_976 [Rhodocyclaceae bacterium]|nr:MAG: hypothetical protein FD157_976 [Rhodocyclaceae bacterium]TND06001.1 MAG: hypothetical protein FD118_73 [Rhodocyclaceae bacterium]
MNPNVRRFKKPALIAAGLIAFVLGFAWLALPGIVQWQAEKFIAEKTGHRLSLARPEINPLALSVRLRELRLADPAGAPLLAFGELFVDLSAASLTQRALVFDEIRLDGLNASLIQRKEGGLNWSPLLDALQSKEPPPEPKGLPRLDIRHLRVSGAQVQVSDQRVTPAFATAIEPLDLDLTDVSTLPDDAGKFRLTAKTLSGAQLTWAGDLTLNPIASAGRIDVVGIDLQRLAPLLQDKLPIAPPSGIVAVGADYRLTQAGGTLGLKLEKIGLVASALLLQQAAGATLPQLAVDRVEIKEGSFDLGTGQLALGAIELQGNRVEAMLDGKERKPLLKLDDIALTDAKVDLPQRKATLAALTFKGGGISARRDAQGRVDLLGLIDSLGKQPAAKTAAAAKPTSQPDGPAAPWRFNVGQVSLAGFTATLRDESVAPAVELELDNIAIAVDSVSENLKAPLPLKASLDVRSGGRLEVAGKLTPADAAADLNVKLANLSLKVAQPYVAKFATLDIAGGEIAAAGRVTRDPKSSGYRGSFAVRDLRLNEAGTKNVFLAWKSLSSSDLALSPTRLEMALLSLDGLDTKLIIDKDKSTNLQRVLRKEQAAVSPAPTAVATPATPAAQAVPPAATAAPTEKEPPGFLVNIDRLRFRGGAMFFADNSLVFPFGTRIHNLRGSIVGLSSRPGAPGQVELDGEVDEFGLARAVGQVDFFKPTEFMDLKVVFRNVEMTHLTPYSATFAGRKINSGKLSLELEYKIKQRQLLGENRIIIDRLELGERVESATAKDLPLDLAIAILSDSDGRIDLGLPISGSLDDPQFSYGAIVWKAITNVLTKIVTAPFRALGALFGGGGEKVDEIAFEAGATRLTPPEREKLVRLATVLNKRPGLALSVSGTWAEVDRVSLQDLQMRRAVADKGGQEVGAKGDPGPLSTRAPKVQAALESLYTDSFGSAELAALKEGFRSANPGQLEESMTGKVMSRLSGLMREKRSLSEDEVGRLKGADFYAVLFERLRAKQVVPDDALQALAVRRAEYAMENLKAAGAPEARIRQGAAAKSATEGRDVLLKLELGKAGG